MLIRNITDRIGVSKASDFEESRQQAASRLAPETGVSTRTDSEREESAHAIAAALIEKHNPKIPLDETGKHHRIIEWHEKRNFFALMEYAVESLRGSDGEHFIFIFDEKEWRRLKMATMLILAREDDLAIIDMIYVLVKQFQQISRVAEVCCLPLKVCDVSVIEPKGERRAVIYAATEVRSLQDGVLISSQGDRFLNGYAHEHVDPSKLTAFGRPLDEVIADTPEFLRQAFAVRAGMKKKVEPLTKSALAAAKPPSESGASGEC